MDEFDLRILSILQRNNLFTIEQIAERVNLSSSAVQRRLRRLRENGTIESDVSVISPEAVGKNFTVIVAVMVERESPQIIDDFKKRMTDAPEVMQCFYVTGNADFIVLITVKDMPEYKDFARRTFTENPYVKHFETSVVIERIKSGLVVRLAAEVEES